MGDERIIIGEVVEATPMGNPVAILYTDPACRSKIFKRLLAFPRLPGNGPFDCEVVCFEMSLN